uniref:RING-type domain-containing protein n=1 Tax=Macrostomum lignano TaxID=282301 RepID=A0A1I8I538_9PLAT
MDSKEPSTSAKSNATTASSLLPSHAELVRAYRMDELWISRIAEHLDRLALAVLGLERYTACRSGLSAFGQVASKALYYGASTAQCLQTLGEEYVNLVQCLFPDLLLWLLRRAEHRCRSDLTLSEPIQRRRLALLSRLSALATSAYELNSALFYINGSYYQLSKRVLGINYLRSRPGLGHVTETLYRLIGWLSLARLAGRAVNQMRSLASALAAAGAAAPTAEPSDNPTDSMSLQEKQTFEAEANNNNGRLNRICPLCCDRVLEASAIALCGHVFCWACIVRCLQLTGRCPLCRLECQPNRVVHLANYSDAPICVYEPKSLINKFLVVTSLRSRDEEGSMSERSALLTGQPDNGEDGPEWAYQDDRPNAMSQSINNDSLEASDPHGLDNSRNSNMSSLMNVLKGNLGTGILAMPVAVKNLGFLLGPLTILAIGCIATHSMHLLVRSAQYLRRIKRVSYLDYSQVMYEATLQRFPGRDKLANVLKSFVNVSLLITQIGFCCVYILFVSDNLHQLVDCNLQPGSSNWDVNIYKVLVMVCLLPYVFVRNLRLLSYFSMLANVMTAIGLVLVFTYCLQLVF